MFLTPHEQEKLMIYVVADLARRCDRGLRLKVAEATRGRDGKGVTELMELGGLRRAVGFNGLANGSTATARPARRAAPGRASKGSSSKGALSMTTTVRWAAVLAAVLLSLAWAAPALACTPPPGGLPIYTIAQRVAAADVVIEGTVASLGASSFPGDTATITVLRVFKGVAAGSVTIVGFGPTSLCRSPVQVAEHLIFFAKSTPSGLAASYLGQFDATAPATQETIDQVLAALNIVPRAFLPMVAQSAATAEAPAGASRAPLLAGPAALALIAGIAWQRRARASLG